MNVRTDYSYIAAITTDSMAVLVSQGSFNVFDPHDRVLLCGSDYNKCGSYYSVSVGRSHDYNTIIQEDHVSGHQFVIIRDQRDHQRGNEGWSIQSCKSRNATFVNAQQMRPDERCPLFFNDVICVGRLYSPMLCFRFEMVVWPAMSPNAQSQDFDSSCSSVEILGDSIPFSETELESVTF